MSLALLAVSVSALSVSLYSLWRTTLSPFSLKVSYNSPVFTLYKVWPEVSGGDRVWWIPSIDVDFTFYNLGKRGGEVTDMRFVGRLTHEGNERTYVLYPKWVVDFRTFQHVRSDRLDWIESSVERAWYPLIIAGDEERTLHLVFEGMRWDEPRLGDLRLSLEIFHSSESRWVPLEEFEHRLTGNMYEDTSAVSLTSDRLRKTRQDIKDEWVS